MGNGFITLVGREERCKTEIIYSGKGKYFNKILTIFIPSALLVIKSETRLTISSPQITLWGI